MESINHDIYWTISTMEYCDILNVTAHNANTPKIKLGEAK